MRFTPNGWKRSRVSRGSRKKKEKKEKIALLATNKWHCQISNIGYYKETNDIKKGQLQQVMVVDAYMLRNAVHTSEIPFS